jgi:hypothetical protein
MTWFEVSLKKLDEEYIRENSENLYWDHLSYNQKLSEELIRDFKDKVDWGCISKHQILSESFIREFADKVDWAFISKYQDLSEDFIYQFQDKIRFIWLIENKNLCKYSEKLQRLILEKIIDIEGMSGTISYYTNHYLTPYMKKQIKKLRIFT